MKNALPALSLGEGGRGGGGMGLKDTFKLLNRVGGAAWMEGHTCALGGEATPARARGGARERRESC